MATLTITNRTASDLPVNSYVGKLGPNETKQVSLTGNELELTVASLRSLVDAGAIQWTTAPSSQDEDNQGEIVVGGGKLLAGTGVPNGLVFGDVGDLYVDKAGGAGTTLYVKESGAGTDTGWVGK